MRPFIVRALQCFYKHDSEDLIKQSANEADSQALASDRLPRVSINLCFTENVFFSKYRVHVAIENFFINS